MLNLKGRLIYVGAGTSGRIGVQDGVELFPTFNWPKKRLDFIIAGGNRAILNAVENAEDDTTEQISLMTLHAAKGLEFDKVFLPGWEDGVFHD